LTGRSQSRRRPARDPDPPGLDVLRFVAVSLVKSLAWLGKHSYSVYLWHVMAGSWLFVLVGFRTHNLPGWLLNVLIYFTLCWTVGILMARLVEFPVLQIRDRLFPGLRLVKLN
jgi:peptidoglycan/LPS O-acetylase OafA/YrhL